MNWQQQFKQGRWHDKELLKQFDKEPTSSGLDPIVFGYGLFLSGTRPSSQGALQQVALVFERLDTVVEHLLQSSELEAQSLQLRRVQLIRLLAVRAIQSAEKSRISVKALALV